jgi:plasmid maintenance system antidote protein VapI
MIMRGFTVRTSKSKPLTSAIKQAIAESGLSFKALERATGVKRQSLMKFMAGEQSLRLDMADKLATYFDLQLEMTRQRPPRKPR